MGPSDPCLSLHFFFLVENLRKIRDLIIYVHKVMLAKT